MSIDLDTNRNSVLQAFNDVVSDKKATDWALFGYEGQSNVLKVVGTGEDGLEELAEDLNSSKIMYAAVRVIDPNTTRPKIILINWQGEGAPTVRKGTCARHLHDIHKLLRGVHVTVNARTEEEVEPDVIMAAVLKASATTYNFNERSEMSDKTTPVGTNYKRTNPLAEIDSKSRNKFWEEQEAEERRRKTEEQLRKEEEIKKLERERKQRELTDAQHREQLTRERNARILAERKAEQNADHHLAAHRDQKWQQELESQHHEEAERAKRAEIMRLERKKEAEALIGRRTHSTRDMFESGITNNKQTTDRNRPPPRRLKEFKPVNSQTREEGKENNSRAPTRGVAARWPPVSSEPREPVVTPPHRRGDAMLPIMSSEKTSTPAQDMIIAQSSPPAPPAKLPPASQHSHTEINNSGSVRQLLRDGIPARPASDDEETLNEWDDCAQDLHHNKSHHEAPVHNTNNLQVHLSSQPSLQQHQYQYQQQQSLNLSPHHLSSLHSTLPHQDDHETLQVSSNFTQQQQQQRQSSLNQGPHYQSSLHSTSPHQDDPETFQVPSNFTNGDEASQIYENTVVDTFKTHHHNGAQERHTYGHTDHSSNIKSSNNANNAYETDAHQNSSTTPGAAPGTTPAVGMVYEVDGMEYQILPEHGLCARALYDYQAADDTEITFDPAEIITNIDQIDEGWWQGVGPDGMFGLFPANYVELINQSPV
ncbi:drebrin-like protein isoform X4 [Cherax quadricarinatus]|uniref:drebrin-like protein isoform X4 n=1 Tax=Cherax quadricarinatus TaxID=27406 RepID=UPI00387EAAB6